MKKEVMKRAWEIYRTLEGDRTAKLSYAMKKAWAEVKSKTSGATDIISQLITLGKEYRQCDWEAYIYAHRDDSDKETANALYKKRDTVYSSMKSLAETLVSDLKLIPEVSYAVYVDGHYDIRTRGGKAHDVASLFAHGRYTKESEITFKPHTHEKTQSFIKCLIDGEKEAERYANM